jgi:hypothetical protein
MTPSEGERRAEAGANARPAKIAHVIGALKWGSQRSRTPPVMTAYVARHRVAWVATAIGQRADCTWGVAALETNAATTLVSNAASTDKRRPGVEKDNGSCGAATEAITPLRRRATRQASRCRPDVSLLSGVQTSCQSPAALILDCLPGAGSTTSCAESLQPAVDVRA